MGAVLSRPSPMTAAMGAAGMLALFQNRQAAARAYGNPNVWRGFGVVALLWVLRKLKKRSARKKAEKAARLAAGDKERRGNEAVWEMMSILAPKNISSDGAGLVAGVVFFATMRAGLHAYFATVARDLLKLLHQKDKRFNALLQTCAGLGLLFAIQRQCISYCLRSLKARAVVPSRLAPRPPGCRCVSAPRIRFLRSPGLTRRSSGARS